MSDDPGDEILIESKQSCVVLPPVPPPISFQSTAYRVKDGLMTTLRMLCEGKVLQRWDYRIDTEVEPVWTLRQRRRDVEKGKSQRSYARYRLLVPIQKRIEGIHPRTPPVLQTCSARSWRGQIRVWRRALHDYDPP